MTEDITGRYNSLLITLTLSGVHWVSKFLTGFHTKSQTIIPLFVYSNTDLLLGALAVDEGHGEMAQAEKCRPQMLKTPVGSSESSLKDRQKPYLKI